MPRPSPRPRTHRQQPRPQVHRTRPQGRQPQPPTAPTEGKPPPGPTPRSRSPATAGPPAKRTTPRSPATIPTADDPTPKAPEHMPRGPFFAPITSRNRHTRTPPAAQKSPFSALRHPATNHKRPLCARYSAVSALSALFPVTVSKARFDCFTILQISLCYILRAHILFPVVLRVDGNFLLI